MPWSFPWHNSIKKKACRYLLHHYLGSFLQEKLSLDQLSIDIYNGTGSIHNVQVDVQAVNTALDGAGLPFEVVDGFVKTITVSIPWSSLITEDAAVEVHGLELTLQPKQRDTAGDPLDMSWLSQSSMTTSLQLAEECMKDENSSSKTLPDGLEAFAKTIESVVSRIKITLSDTVIRIEHCPVDSVNGIALELRIGRVEYLDEASKDLGSSVDDASPLSEPSTFSIKNIHINGGVSLYTDVFSPCHRNSNTASVLRETSMSATMASDIFTSASSVHMKPILRQPSYISSSRSTEGLPQEHNNINSDPVKFLTATGEQRIKIKIKNDDKVPGPKTSIDIQMSSIGILFIPKQVHFISELVTAFSEAAKYSSGGDAERPGAGHTKHMGSDDLRLLEDELHNQMIGSPPRDLIGPESQPDYNLLMHDPMDHMSVDSHMFQSVAGGHNSGMSDMMTSSIYSGYSGSTLSTNKPASSTYRYGSERSSPRRQTHRQPSGGTAGERRERFDETKAQRNLVKANVAFLIAVLLNEDPQSTPADAFAEGETDMEKLKKKSNRFFDGFESQSTKGVVDLRLVREEVETYCVDNHVKLIAKKLDIDIKQQMQQSSGRRKKSEINAEISLGLCEVTEYLSPDEKMRTFAAFNQQPVSEILTFSMKDSSVPCIRATFTASSSTKPGSDGGAQRSYFNIRLCRECTAEVDISIADRLNDLLNPTPVFTHQSHRAPYSPHTSFNSYTTNLSGETSMPSANQGTDLVISSESDATIMLRFPVADLRKAQSERLAWWRRNLRHEILELQVTKPLFRTKIGATSPDGASVMEFTCRSLRGYFWMGVEKTKIAFANIGQEVGDKDGLEWARLVIKSYPVKSSSLLEEEENGSPFSLEDACSDMAPGDPSPFSRHKAMYNNEELKVPGSKREISDFEHQTKSNTQLHIQLDLPAVNMVAPSKQMFELLYNRLCNDLLLWESLAPVPVAASSSMRGGGLDQGLNDLSLWGASKYIMCKSSLLNGSDSDDDRDDGADEMLYSIHTPSQREQRKHGAQARSTTGSVGGGRAKSGQSKACVMITIKKGRLTMVHPVKGANKSVIPGCYGQSALDLQDGVIYINSKSMGDPNLGYVSIHSSQCTLYHQGCIRGAYRHPDTIERLQSTAPNLPVTLTLCTPGIPNRTGYTVGSKGDEDMLSVAIKIALDPDPRKHLKRIVVSVALKRACLHHKMSQTSHMWITQLMEFLAVDDYDVLGYPFPKVLTDLHVHIIGSAISYVPENLPIAGLLTLEKFSISSNVVVNSPVSLLRFLVEDAALYLTDKDYTKMPLSIQVKNDYVCLIELSHFQLDWKSSDGKNLKYPRTDLCACCTSLHIRVCADSLSALQQFIVFLAENGDLTADSETAELPASTSSREKTPPSVDSRSTTRSPLHTSADSVESSLTDSGGYSEEEGDMRSSNVRDDEVPDLMMDAMEDPMTASFYPHAQDRQTFPNEMFLFPNENSQTTPTSTRQIHSSQSEQDEESEDDIGDFCFVDIPNIPKEGVPVIDSCDSDAIQIKEDFFLPPKSRVDLLNPPKSFPNPVSRYSLSDLTLVLDLYGGHDFGNRNDASGNRESSPHGRSNGGAGRDLDKLIELQLSKIRLHNENYPDNTTQVCRQCLLIQDVEIRDRLVMSDVNKLLYQYTSERVPKQQHTSMISLKMVTNRPDVTKPDTQESDVRVSIQPLRINIDQDALLFLQAFFTELAAGPDNQQDEPAYSLANDPHDLGQAPSTRAAQSPPSDVPVMSLKDLEEKAAKDEGRVVYDEIDEGESEAQSKETTNQPTFFIKNFVFTPDVPVRLDYVGKHVDVEQRLQGLLIGLAQLNRAELRLKSLHLRQGVLGIDKLLSVCLDDWKRDITRSQIPAIIGGVGPLNSFVQFFQGVQDLVWLPIEQYRKDGRIVRGLQRGANAFSTSTTVAFLELTNRAVQTIQSVAEVTFDLVSPGTAKPTNHLRQRKSQPRDMREGVSNAYRVVTEGVSDTASNVYKTAAKETEIKGITGAVGGVVRQIPPSMIQPIILAADATSNVLSGMRNQLHPDAHREDQEKWKSN